jgi:serine/threonine-protein kinase
VAIASLILVVRGGGSPVAAGLALLAGGGLGAGIAARVFARTRERLEQELADSRRIGNWKLEEMLGRGGMGEVWRASHVLLPRPAAIKFIRPEALGAGDPESARKAIQRFRREARAVASLTSPHTIEIYDFGVAEDGSLSYVMEFLDGLDLETLVKRYGPLAPARAVYLLRQVCISLAEAHSEGLVHRDLKPANIYACRKGIQHDFVKVLDFGMVADLTGKVDGAPTTDIGGTPAYIAPEIVTGHGCDGRSDLYSLGCVANFLLTGQTVFAGKTTPEQLRHHIHSRPEAPSRRAPHAIPRELDLVILACLAKSPDDRPRSAAELSKRLSACDVGPAWTPGQAMEWWTSRAKDAASSTQARVGAVESAKSVERPSARPASAIAAR